MRLRRKKEGHNLALVQDHGCSAITASDQRAKKTARKELASQVGKRGGEEQSLSRKIREGGDTSSPPVEIDQNYALKHPSLYQKAERRTAAKKEKKNRRHFFGQTNNPGGRGTPSERERMLAID